MDSKMRSTVNNKKQDGKYKKKNIKHDPQAESAKAAFINPGKMENQ